VRQRGIRREGGWPDRDFEANYVAPEQEARYEVDVWEEASSFLDTKNNVTVSEIACHAGWIALPEMYDDGGLSGGTIEGYSSICRKQKYEAILGGFLAGGPGFEPRLTESESFIRIRLQSSSTTHPSCKVTRGGVNRVGFHTAQSFRSLAQ
jgi:hypothetical protein